MTPTERAYLWRHAWRFQGGDRWSRDMTPLQVFLAQSNGAGFPRLAGIACTLLADVIQFRIAGPLLRRSMKGEHLGLDAKPLSLTWLARKACNVATDARWALERHAVNLARYNRSPINPKGKKS